MINIERMTLSELRDTVNTIVLDMIEELEMYEQSPRRRFKSERYYREVCNEGSRLLDKLGVRGITEGELHENSSEVKRCIHSLKTLAMEDEQERIDEEVIKMAYMTIRKYAPKLSGELTEYYMLNGPESQKDSDF